MLTLNKTTELTLTDLKNKVNCSLSALYTALGKLKVASLIQEDLEDTFPRRRLISLTAKGKKVAEKLEEIERILRA